MSKFKEPQFDLDDGFAHRRFTQNHARGHHNKRNNAGSMVSLSKYQGNGPLNTSVGGAPGAGTGSFGSGEKLEKSFKHHQGVSSVNYSGVDLEKSEDY